MALQKVLVFIARSRTRVHIAGRADCRPVFFNLRNARDSSIPKDIGLVSGLCHVHLRVKTLWHFFWGPR